MVPGRHDLTGLAGKPAGWPAVATRRRRPRHLCSVSLRSAWQSRPGRDLRSAGVSRRTRRGRAGLSNPLDTHPRRSGAYPSGRTPLRDLRRAFFPARPGCADSPRAPNLRPTLSPPLDPVKAAPADSTPAPGTAERAPYVMARSEATRQSVIASEARQPVRFLSFLRKQESTSFPPQRAPRTDNCFSTAKYTKDAKKKMDHLTQRRRAAEPGNHEEHEEVRRFF
jgi:hypothetical protein